MLIIHKEQMRAFEAKFRREFIDRTTRETSKKFPEQIEEMFPAEERENQTRFLVKRGIEKANSYGIEAEADVTRFIDFMFLLSPNFDEASDTEWAREILDEQETSGHLKIQLIELQLPPSP